MQDMQDQLSKSQNIEINQISKIGKTSGRVS